MQYKIISLLKNKKAIIIAGSLSCLVILAATVVVARQADRVNGKTANVSTGERSEIKASEQPMTSPSSSPAPTASASPKATAKTTPAAKSTSPTPKALDDSMGRIVEMSGGGNTEAPDCYKIPIWIQLTSKSSTTITYYWKNEQGIAGPTSQLAFNGVETKKVEYRLPFVKPPQNTESRVTDLKGKGYFVITSPISVTHAVPYHWTLPDTCYVTPSSTPYPPQ